MWRDCAVVRTPVQKTVRWEADDNAERSKRERPPDRRANHWRVPGRSQYDCLCRAHRGRVRWLYTAADLRRPWISSRIGSNQPVPPRVYGHLRRELAADLAYSKRPDLPHFGPWPT